MSSALTVCKLTLCQCKSCFTILPSRISELMCQWHEASFAVVIQTKRRHLHIEFFSPGPFFFAKQLGLVTTQTLTSV